MQRVALLFSGQGAQAVGMGKDLAEEYPAVAELVRRADDVLGRSLSRIMFEGPEEELVLTKNCQPALYVHGLACWTALTEELGELPVAAAAGLSLGEFTAHAVAGTFDFETGLKLVERRGELMQEACDATEGAMAAMIGADENVVRDLASETDVDIANLNSPGQVVISGEASKVALAVSLAKEKGIRRAQLLNVAGAYHSRLMRLAYERLGEVLASMELREPKFPVVSNVDAMPVHHASQIRESLQEQVTGTVRWYESLEYLIDRLACDQFIELGPGGVLAGLLNRTRKGTPVVSVGDLAGLRLAVEALEKSEG
jgi:[acyl-carrier-protein] S-malonyltransferase